MKDERLIQATILDSIAELVTYQDAEHRVLWANKAAGESVGAAVGELIGRRCHEIWQQRDIPCENCPVAKVWETDRVQEGEQTSPDGRIWLVRGYPVRDEANGREVVGVIEVIREITERRQAEKALRESEQMYRALFEQANDPALLVTLDGRILDVNQRASALLGYDREELLHLIIEDIVPSHVPTQLSDVATYRHAHENVRRETEVIHKDGTHIPVEISSSRFRLRGERRILAILRDISERKRVEETLKRRAAQLATLNRIGRDVTAILDQQELLQRAVDAVREDLGYLRAAILLVDESSGELYVSAATDNFWKLVPDGYRQTSEQGVVGKAFRTGKTILVDDGAADPRVYPVDDWLAPSSLSIPIKARGRVIGVLEVEAEVVEAFDENDQVSLEILAHQIAIAIQNARLYRKAQQRTVQLEALQEVSLAITAQLDLDELLQTVVERGCRLLDIKAGCVFLVDETMGDLELIVSHGYTQGDYVGARMLPGEGTAGKVFQSGEPLVVDNYHRWQGRSLDWEREPITANIGLPLKHGEKIIGVLVFGELVKERHFDKQDVWLATLFASQAAIVIENARLYREARRRAAQAALIYEVGQRLSGELELDVLLSAIVTAIRDAFDYHSVMLLLLDDEDDHLKLQAITGAYTDVFPDDLSVAVDEGMIGRAAATGETQISADVSQDIYFVRKATEDTKSELAVPIRSGQKVIGVLDLQDDKYGVFDEIDMGAMEALSTQIAIAIENARLFREEHKQRAMAEALEEASAAVNSTLDLDQVLDRILEQVERVVAGDAFNVMLVEEGVARVVRWRGYDKLGVEEQISRFVAPVADYPMLVKMMRKGKSVVVPNADAEPDWNRPEGWDWLRSFLGSPIQVGGEVVGFLNVVGTRLEQFDRDDARRLEAFADHAGTAVENARLYQETSRRLAQTEVLREVMMAAASTLDFDQILDRTIDVLERAMGVEYLGFIFPDEDGRFMESHPSLLGFSTPPDGVYRYPVDQCITGRVYRTGEPVLLSDVREAPDYAVISEEVRSELAVPVQIDDEVVAVLNLESSQPDAFVQEDLVFYTAIAGQLGVAIENARLYSQLRGYAEQLEERVEERTAQLRAQFAQLETVLDSTADGIIVVSAEGELTLANPVAQTWLDQTLSPEDAGRLRELARDMSARAEKRPVELLELTGLDLELSCAPIPDSRGQENGTAAVVAIHDVSHLKALERMKSRFVSNVSHELRTPVTTIKLFAELMEQQPEERENYLKLLIQEANHQARLVESILEISRIDAGRLEVNPRPMALNDLTAMLVVNHDLLIERENLILDHRPATPSPVALVDPKRMMQVLNNLMGNAIRYTPPGGKVVVCTETREAEGRVWATVMISDTGIGIPEDELPHIFDRFFRGEEPQTRQISGTGLGLAIVNEIVELHGGRVTVDSEQGEGSTFTVWLPRAV